MGMSLDCMKLKYAGASPEIDKAIDGMENGPTWEYRQICEIEFKKLVQKLSKKPEGE